jgi:type II secretory pathway component GspD/PulD (secretin)
MAKSVLAFCLFIGSTALASGKAYDLKLNVSIEGKIISTPRIIVKEGETGSITQDGADGKTYIEVVATEGSIENHKGILMNFVVAKIGADGKKQILGKPRILAKENERAMLMVGDENGKETLSMAIVAKRKVL